MAKDLAKWAKDKGVKYFMVSYTDLFGGQRAKLVPTQAINDMAVDGAGFAGFATWLDLTPAHPDLMAVPDPTSVIQLPWKKDVAWVAARATMEGKLVDQAPRNVLERLVAERGCDVFNLRVSKNGGLLNTARLYRLAMAAGLRCQLGAQVGETGLLSAAGRHVATRLADILWCEGSYGWILLRPEIVTPDITVGRGGWAPALTAPGLGVTPEATRLERFTTARRALG